MKRIAIPLIFLAFALTACNLPAGTATPTEVVITEFPTPSPTEESIAIPLPAGLPVVDAPALIFVDFQDAAHGWGLASTGTGSIVRSEDGGATWLDVTPSRLTEVGYATHLSILDVNTVWALIPNADFVTGTLYRTADGGATWTSNPVPFGGADVQFLDPGVGRALADRGAGAGSNAVEMYQTSDGGLTWVSVYQNDPTQPGSSDSLPLSGIKNGMTFVDANTGWVTGTRPVDGEIYLFFTHDGGATWAMQGLSLPDGYEYNQYMPFAPLFFGQEGFLPVTISFPGGNLEQVFFVTHDGGATWSADPENASQVITYPGRFAFADALNGYAWNGGGLMYFTTDGAQNWAGMAVTLDLTDTLAQLDFVDAYTGWALTGQDETGVSRLFHTEDGGVSWTQLTP